MKRKVKFIFTFLFIMVLAFSLKVVYAGNTSGGGGSKPGGCSDGCEWKYSGIGVRLSLYKYNGKQLSYIGSEDYCAGGRGMTSCFEGRKALQTLIKIYLI